MKKRIPFLFIMIASLVLAGCRGAPAPTEERELTVTLTVPVAKSTVTPTQTLPLPTASEIPSGTAIPTMTPTGTPTIPPEARLKFQCLEVEPNLPPEATSSGIVLLESRVSVDGFLKPDRYLLDMQTREAIEGEHGDYYSVSPDRKLMAFVSPITDKDNRIIREELIIATAHGQRLKTIPWEKGWMSLVGWLDNDHLVISLTSQDPEVDFVRKPGNLLALDPFKGTQQILRPDFPRFLYTTATVLPYWDGWYGVMYDPTLTLAIYPRFTLPPSVKDEDQMFTYAIWDITKHKLVASLEDISATFSLNNFFPMPRWSPDGSQFVFVGANSDPSNPDPVEFELYQVSRDGQTRQLTHLTPFALVQDKNLSWSPDGRYIAMFLNNWGVWEKQARVAVLDTETLDITDYCLPITYSGEGYGGGQPPAPIWSPDGKQFLVVDRYEKEHRDVILVDIVKGFAARIAEDMEPVGWMKAEE